MEHLVTLIDRYMHIWNETDAAKRRSLIAQTLGENASYLDPLTHAYGHECIDAMVDGAQQRFPGHRFERTGEIDCQQDRLRFRWRMSPDKADAAGAMRVEGTDFAVVADGLLQSITGFHDPAPAATMPAQAVSRPRGWSVQSFAAFWSKPDPALVPRALTPDVAGYWPGNPEPVRGIPDYTRRIADLVAAMPDFRLEVAEHAVNGDCVFIHWIARGTYEGRAIEFNGVDRVRMRDGLVAENRIFCDHPLIHALAQGRLQPQAIAATA